ncbi:MAG TPA: hypothetical protein VMJ32_02925 [Pirellulales bacterium]|nr:hypothetical protein [Pirellulales bacterium]
MFPSRVAGIARQLGARMEIAATADALLAKLITESPQAGVVLLDLNSPGVEPSGLLPRLKALATPPQTIIAFGPHVHQQKLAAAQTAGCNVVLTRGQFDAQMQSLLTHILRPSEIPRPTEMKSEG